MAPFKVIIVGGSVAGLTLANILEQYGIEYVLFEKHATIAPQLGASIAILPHGSRILDQLGIYESVEPMTMPLNILQAVGPKGVPLGRIDLFGDSLEEILGYRMRFLDRQDLLQALFDNIQDKSKIHTSCQVFKIDDLNEGVKITLRDGSTFQGDILVGADGVHSRIRQEIWRIADSETLGHKQARMNQPIVCNYKAFFGICKRPQEIRETFGFKTFNQGRSYLCVTGPDDKMYYFGFFKTTDTNTLEEIPRYTADDAKKLVAEYADDVIYNGVTLGHLQARSTNLAMVPVEEYVLEKCFYKRAILIGDAFHKINPLSGHGGNAAIESATLLANLLKTASLQGSPPDNHTIQRLFSKFQRHRRPRTKRLMEGTRQLQRLEVLDNPVLKFVHLNFTSKLPVEGLTPTHAEASCPGPSLQFLPLKARRGLVAFEKEVKVRPKRRPAATTRIWAVTILLTALLRPMMSIYFPGPDSTGESSGALQAYIGMTTIAINGLWVVESHRWELLISPRSSAIPYVLASMAFGWELVLPIYFALHIYQSAPRTFYYPFPRTIDSRVAKALPIGLLMAYTIPVLQAVTSLSQTEGQGTLVSTQRAFAFAHLSLPILLRVGKSVFKKYSVEPSVGVLLFGNQDLKYLSRFFTMGFLLTSTVHLVFVSQGLPSLLSDISDSKIVPSTEGVQVGCLAFTVVVWSLFVVWDLRRVKIIKGSLPMMMLGAIAGSVFLGPAAVLAALWGWREHAWAQSRIADKLEYQASQGS